MRAVTDIFSFLLDVVFPPQCAACGVAGASYLCAHCLDSIPQAHCGDLPQGIRALFDYADPRIRAALWALKYRGVKKLAEPLGVLLYEELLDLLGEKAMWRESVETVIVPIPLSRRRLWKRGFNQSALLARATARNDTHLCMLAAGALVRVKNAPPQTECVTRAQRLKNLTGAFSVVMPATVKGKNVVVVDDVTTTGATFAEARRALLKAGAREVVCLAVAH